MVNEHDNASLLANTEEIPGEPKTPNFKNVTGLPAEVELQEVHTLQADLVNMQAKLWAADTMTDEEQEELERKSNMLKIKLAQASDCVKEWGMTTGLERLHEHEETHKKWHAPKPANEKLICLGLLPVAILFMGLVISASLIHFDDSEPIHGELFAVTDDVPVVWPLGSASYLVEARVQIPSTTAPGGARGGGGHRRRSKPNRFFTGGGSGGLLRRAGQQVADMIAESKSKNSAAVQIRSNSAPSHSSSSNATDNWLEIPTIIKTTYVINATLFEMKNDEWRNADVQTLPIMIASSKSRKWLGTYRIDATESSKLLEIELEPEPLGSVLVFTTDSPIPRPIAIQIHSLGALGPYQVVLAGLIMIVVFGLIMTEVLHRTMAAMIGATCTMIVLALQNRVPSLSTVVGWMDHGTLGLLWGMMLIVGITMRTGVFEWTGVMACKLSGGNKTKLLFLLCIVTAILSAFLDNVTTILLIAPVTCKLCKLVDIDPVPYLVSEALFSNLGGTATMIGDPPNIIIGNMLAEYLDFNDFLFNLAPGVILSCPPTFAYLVWYYKDGVKGQLDVDIAKLQKMYPITDRGLLIKCGVVLGCVISSFFLHPVTHLDPAWIAIMGAVWLLVAFDMHHCHEALAGVEWDTLLFFAALFVVVEGVGELGLLRFIANTLSGMVGAAPEGSRQLAAICLIIWASAIFSAFVDNIPFTATMVPVMLQLVEKVTFISIEPLAWALAFGACFGGNGTLIGASANIVMASKAEVEGHHITFVQFFKVGFPIMLITVAVSNVYLIALNAIFWQANAGVGVDRG